MKPIIGKAVKRIPYIGPLISGLGLALDVKNVIEDATPMEAAKIIARRFVKECTPPELFIAGKFIAGDIVASISTSGDPLVIYITGSADRSSVKDL